MRSLILLSLAAVAVASCVVPKQAVDRQVAVVDRLRADSATAHVRVLAVRDSLQAIENWGEQSEKASVELARELERKANELQLAQLRADSLHEVVIQLQTAKKRR